MIHIQPYRPEQAQALSDLYRASVLAIGPARYSAAQIAAWLSLAPSPDQLEAKMEDGRDRTVAVGDDGRPLAFADVGSDGHIDLLYRHPDADRLATALLYAALESRALATGLSRLTAHASELARPFFVRQGFSVLERRDFEVEGVAIHNFAVEKRLHE